MVTVHIHPIVKEDEVALSNKTAFQALIDTGAQKSCISSNIVKKLGLIPTGKAEMQSASHVLGTLTYDIMLFIPITNVSQSIKAGSKISKHKTSLKKYLCQSAIEMKATDNHEMLLGMDVLQDCSFFLAHGGFYLSY